MIFSNILYLIIVTTLLYLIGIIGLILNRKNILIIIMFLEIMLLAINFITFSIYLDALLGQMFVLYILTVACYIIVYRISYFSCFFFELKKLD